MLSEKAAEEVRETGQGRLAGELERAVGEMLGFEGEAEFEPRAPAK